jgi:hypothetical protein
MTMVEKNTLRTNCKHTPTSQLSFVVPHEELKICTLKSHRMSMYSHGVGLIRALGESGMVLAPLISWVAAAGAVPDSALLFT